MNVEKFVSSIYLGDRACKKIIIDSWRQELSIEVDTISRIRSNSGSWDFYRDEDIKFGQLVFEKVTNIIFDGSGYIPNDQINSFDVIEHETGSYCFTLSIDSVDDNGANQEVVVKITAVSIGIRNPLNPEVLVVD